MTRNKYGAKRCEIDGYKFDSLLEGRRYQELILLQRANRIDTLIVHPVFPLRAWDGRIGTVIGSYAPDFTYHEIAEPGVRGPFIAEDCKGVIPPLSRWKIKHFEAQYGTSVRIVRTAGIRRAA